MRILFLSAISATLLVGSISTTNAQPPQEIVGADTIQIQTGQTRTFMFQQSVNRFSVSADGVVEVRPETDRTFTIRAISPGQVLMTAYAPDGQVVHRSNVSVADAGHLVKIYGFGGDTKDYIGLICTEAGCGRADPDIAQKPSPPLTAETQNKGDRNAVTTAREDR
ncbi:pilus assembly protein N-terminal domain-containing protein [Bradyrhizobium sp. CB82]|uniref:pilus assembly protein N-terminal domain-containing protein n=1 Tax=Bradyrhizobium sp. CB82 TaxID=3039159 RepID=UPI0024B12A26|nr:pilus assembly protein N-terminal domain-containing protein [Bradyrhizobium sp. CB82]WFU38794.1 pilus assembly protein N-terminal domain-containing protein [Bradyrhizobium sp. CB82]